MTRVLVAVKRVADSSGEPVLTEDRQGLDGRYAGWTVGGHDTCAVELGVRIAEATGGTVTVVSIGEAAAIEQVRGALALGAHAAVLVEAEPSGLGPADVARELAAVASGPASDPEAEAYDLVLLGNDAPDTGDFQVPIRVAYALGHPVVTGVARAEVRDGALHAMVTGPHGEEAYEVPLPAVASVLEGGTEPRYPTLKGRMAAKKVDVEVRTPSAAPTGGGRVGWHLPDQPAASGEVLDEGTASAPAVVDIFERLGVLR